MTIKRAYDEFITKVLVIEYLRTKDRPEFEWDFLEDAEKWLRTHFHPISKNGSPQIDDIRRYAVAIKDRIKITFVLPIHIFTSEEVKIKEKIWPEDTELIETELTTDEACEDALKRIAMKGTSVATYLKRVREEMETIRKRWVAEKSIKQEPESR